MRARRAASARWWHSMGCARGRPSGVPSALVLPSPGRGHLVCLGFACVRLVLATKLRRANGWGLGGGGGSRWEELAQLLKSGHGPSILAKHWLDVVNAGDLDRGAVWLAKAVNPDLGVASAFFSDTETRKKMRRSTKQARSTEVPVLAKLKVCVARATEASQSELLVA
jgi:hypothetical protein